MYDRMLDLLKRNNRDWAARKISADPGFFKRLEAQQAPEYLWIGCSDSRVPANEIVGLDPGEMFVHRNVANLAPPQDANYLSVLQFAVDVLRVKHILVVGHYGCGGIAAAVDGHRRGLVDHWLHPIREVETEHRAELDAIPAPRARLDRLTELNVMRQVRNVTADVFVQGRLDARADVISPRLGLFDCKRARERTLASPSTGRDGSDSPPCLASRCRGAMTLAQAPSDASAEEGPPPGALEDWHGCMASA